LFLSGVATSSAIASSELKTGINVFCDIGSDITEILIFKEGMLRNIEILKMGGESLTLQLAETLKIPRELAEDVKKSYLSAGDFERIPDNKEILVKKESLYKPIKQKEACRIITAQTTAVCKDIKAAVEKAVSLSEVNNFFVTGRTVFLAGVIEIMEAQLGIPVKLGRISNSHLADLLHKYEALSGQKYLTYITALGMICQAEQEDAMNFTSIAKSVQHPVSKVVDRIREVYQEYF
jgi:cell division protein FtsA